MGWVPDSVYPLDPGKVNEEPPANVVLQAYDARGLAVYQIPGYGMARIEGVRRALMGGHPVVFGMRVDVINFEAWDGTGIIDNIDLADPEGGGHGLCVLADETAEESGAGEPAIRFANWWTNPDGNAHWGLPDGTGRLSYRQFGSANISNVYAIQSVPTLNKRAA